jgi:hypothetical protein
MNHAVEAITRTDDLPTAHEAGLLFELLADPYILRRRWLGPHRDGDEGYSYRRWLPPREFGRICKNGWVRLVVFEGMFITIRGKLAVDAYHRKRRER